VPETVLVERPPSSVTETDDALPYPTPSEISRPVQLSRDEACLLAVAAQGLDRRPPARVRRDKDLLLATIRHLGCIQLDTISVISRSHETVLWSRLGPYDPALLSELHYPDEALIEYWAHAAALVPIDYFPYFRRYMASFAERYADWFKENQPLLDRVLGAVRERGPLPARHFERPEGPKPDPWTWYGGKPERQALDALWTIGELMILKREAFQRTYELTERLLPGARDGDLPPLEEEQRWFTGRALTALGVATPRWVADYFRSGSKPHVHFTAAAKTLAALADEGLAVPAEVEGLSDPTWISRESRALLEELRSGGKKPSLTTLLTPFDNLIWHRGRTADLFGFDYKIEVYTPAPKRIYGYYNMPILHRGRLVGRLDPSYDRRARVLTVRTLHLEPGVTPTDRLAAAVAEALHDLLAFLGGQDIGILASNPPTFGPLLQRAIESTPAAKQPRPSPRSHARERDKRSTGR
jgi:uncharacterized protein YcaQ